YMAYATELPLQKFRCVNEGYILLVYHGYPGNATRLIQKSAKSPKKGRKGGFCGKHTNMQG
ncbi:hypothetical protein JVW08_20335, partial [Vibrio cholerae O1]|uniref:hypothetical protein n=1 Tax=Vibrio cholerae TaxID=666 RepID=UPI001C126DD0